MTTKPAVYNAATLDRALLLLERRFGLSSADFFDAHRRDDPQLHEMPQRLRQLWANLYRERRRLGEDPLIGEVERELALNGPTAAKLYL